MIKQGALRGQMTLYDDGLGGTVWYPLPQSPGEKEAGVEEAGLCFDFRGSDIDDFIALLEQMKHQSPDDQRTKPGRLVKVEGKDYKVVDAGPGGVLTLAPVVELDVALPIEEPIEEPIE